MSEQECRREVHHGILIEWDVPITTNDGTALRCDVFRPNDDGKYPVIMGATPYGKLLSFKDEVWGGQWKLLQAHEPEILKLSSNRFQNYEFADPPHKAPLRAIESFDELASIAVVRDFFYDKDGQPTERLAQLERAVSLYDFPSANINGASEEALILAGLDATQAARILDFNAGKGRRASDQPQFFRAHLRVGVVIVSFWFDHCDAFLGQARHD